MITLSDNLTMSRVYILWMDFDATGQKTSTELEQGQKNVDIDTDAIMESIIQLSRPV
jgi:hypothetical protein